MSTLCDPFCHSGSILTGTSLYGLRPSRSSFSTLLGYSWVPCSGNIRKHFKFDVLESTVFENDEAVSVLTRVPKADEQIRLTCYVMAVGQHFVSNLLAFRFSILGDISAIVNKQF